MDDIYPSILQLLSKPRMKIDKEMPDWRTLINFHPTLKTRIIPPQSPADFTYLPPLVPLDIPDDISDFDPDTIRFQKQQYLSSLHETARFASCNKTMLVCRHCSQEICTPFNISFVNNSTCAIIPMYGALEHIDPPSAPTPFVGQSPPPSEYVVCVQSHIIGWVSDRKVYINSQSPVQLLFPTLVRMDWDPSLLMNDKEGLMELDSQYTSKYNSVELELYCPLCVRPFPSKIDFSIHFSIDETHKHFEARFLSNYIP